MKDPNKIDLGFSVDVASLNSANKLIQSVTSSIGSWIQKVGELGKTTGTFDQNLQKTLQKTGESYEGLDKKTGGYLKNKKKIEEFGKTLKGSNAEYTKYNKKLKESGKSLTDFAKSGSESIKMTSKNQRNLKNSLKSSMSDLDDFTSYKPKSQFVQSMNEDLEDFAGFDEMSRGLSKFDQQQEDILSNLNSSLDSVYGQTGKMNDKFDDSVLSLAELGDEIQENEKKSIDFIGSMKSGFSKVQDSAASVGRGLSKVPGGIMSAGKGVGKAISSISSKMNELQGSMRSGFSSLTSTIKDSAFSLSSLFPPLAALGGAAGGILTIKGAFESAWNAGQELEKMTVKMTNRFGSSDYAKKATGFINDMSQQYGIAKDDLASYTDQLGEMGLSIDKVNFKGVLNAAEGPGKDLQSTMSAMTALAKGGDFQSFTESFGNTIDPAALQEALAGASTYQERMQKTADFLDTQFAGNADRVKNSTEGQIASLSGFFEKLQQTISSSGAFKAMQDTLSDIFKVIEDNKENILAVGQVIGSMMGTVIKFIGGLLKNIAGSMGGATDFFKTIVTKVKDVFYPVIFILGFIGMKIGKMIGKFFGGKGDLASGVTGIGDIISMLIDFISGLVGKAFDLLTSLFSWFNSQLPKLIPAVVGAFGKIIDSLVGFLKMIGSKLAALWPEVLKTLSGLIKMIVPILKKLLIGALQVIVDWLPKLAVMLWDTLKWVAEQLIYIGPAIADALSEGLGFIGKWLSDWIGGIADKLLKSDNPVLQWLGKMLVGVKVIWDSVISVLRDAVSKAGEIIASIGEFFSSIFSGDFMGAGGKIFDIFNNLGSFISGTFSKLFSNIIGFVADWLSDLASSLMNSDNPFMNFIGGIVQYFADGFKAIKTIFSSVFSFIGGVVSDIGSLVGNIFGNIFDFFKNLFTGNFGAAWDNIKNIFGAIWDFVKSLMGRIFTLIWDTFGAIGTFLWDTLKNIWKTFVTMLGNIFKGVGEWIANMWKSFVDFLGSLPEKFITAFLSIKDGILETLKAVPDAIIGLVSFIPKKIFELLQGGFSAVGNIGESIFGEGFFDPLIRMFKGFMNFVIKGLNNILPGGMKIPVLYDDSGLKDQAKEMATTVGQIMADPTKSTDFTPIIKKLHDQVETLASDQGAISGSAMSKAYQSITDEMYKINGQIGAAGNDLVKKQALMAKLVDYSATLQQLPKSNLSKTGEFNEEKSAEGFVGWVKKESGAEIKSIGDGLMSVAESVLNKTLAEQKGNSVKDAIVKDGKVHPMDQNDQAIVSKDPGFLANLAKGDVWGAIKSIGSNVSSAAKTLSPDFNASNLLSSIGSVAQKLIGQEEISKEIKTSTGQKVSVGNLGFKSPEFAKLMQDYGGYAIKDYSKLSEDQIKEGAAWCASFVKASYGSVLSAVPQVWEEVKKVFTPNAQVTLSNAAKSGFFELSKKDPKVGSLVGWSTGAPVTDLESFKKQTSFGSGHLGLVSSLLGGGGFTTVEGNSGKDGEGREGIRVSQNTFPKAGGTYDKGKLKFIGFANPKFDDLLKNINVKGKENKLETMGDMAVSPEGQIQPRKIIAKGSQKNPGKDFVMRPGEEPLFFEPTDTVFGVRKSAGLENTETKDSIKENNITVNFGPNSIVMNSVSPTYDAKKLYEEIKTLMRREQGRIYGTETKPY